MSNSELVVESEGLKCLGIHRISLQRAIVDLEDHGFLIYGQHAILTPLSGLHPTSQMQIAFEHVSSTSRKLRTLRKSKFRRKLPSSKIRDAGTKMFDDIPRPNCRSVSDKHLRHGGSGYETSSRRRQHPLIVRAFRHM